MLCRLFFAAVMLQCPHLARLGQASHLAALPPWPNTTNTRKDEVQTPPPKHPNEAGVPLPRLIIRGTPETLRISLI